MSTEKPTPLPPLQKTGLVITIIVGAISVIGTPFWAIAWLLQHQEKQDTIMIERDKLMITHMVERDKLLIERDKLGTDRGRLDLEYVRLAIGILQPTEKIEQPQKELRGWAVEILQDSSPRKLSDEAAKALKNGDANVLYGSGYSDLGYSEPIVRSGKIKPSAPAPGQTPSPKAQ